VKEVPKLDVFLKETLLNLTAQKTESSNAIKSLCALEELLLLCESLPAKHKISAPMPYLLEYLPQYKVPDSRIRIPIPRIDNIFGVISNSVILFEIFVSFFYTLFFTHRRVEEGRII
jgi:hypothetical protein